MSGHVNTFMRQTAEIAGKIDANAIEILADELLKLRERGNTLFLIGLGGSAANCEHAAADFRRLANINAKSLAGSMAELTAVANDEGWHRIFSWHLWNFGRRGDAIMVFSVGGGTNEVSVPIVEALEAAQVIGMRIYGVVGRDGGFTARMGDCVIVVPTVDLGHVTPHTEAWHMVITHLLVSHPKLQHAPTKW